MVTTRRRFSKDDIEVHSEGYGRGGNPAVNVKVHNFGAGMAQRLAEHYNIDDDDPQIGQALEWAFESHQVSFWEVTPTLAEWHLSAAFGGNLKVYSEGRSGGWLVVGGLGDIADWDAIRVSAWGRFEQAVRAEVDFLCTYEQIFECIDANGWID